jgi:hypothetical protein
MKKKIVALGILGAVLFSSAAYAEDYWTGDGGRDMSLAVNEPRGIGLAPEDQYLSILVQSYFAIILGTYSAINVRNRMNTDAILREAELQYEIVDIDKIFKVDYLLVGDLIKTLSAFALTIQIIRAQDARIVAAHSGVYTRQEIEDKSAVNKATLYLLGQMGVTLTDQARAELGQAAVPLTFPAEGVHFY